MQKILYAMFFVMFINTFVFGQINNSQKRILSSNMDKIRGALPVLEKKLKGELKEYQKYIDLYNEIKRQLKKSNSFIDKGVLKTKSLFYSQRASSYRKKVKEQRTQLLIYYCVLDVLRERNISEEEIHQGKKMIKAINKQLKWATKQRLKVVKRKKHAEQRLRDIPEESGATKVKLSSVRKELEALEYKKSWSNLPQRSMLRGKIAFYQSKIGKLKAETLLQKKVIEDSIQELKSFLIEITEAEVAIRRLE